MGSGYGHFEVLGGGVLSPLDMRGYNTGRPNTEGLNMQIKRLLDDREVFAGDRLFDAQRRSYAFVEHLSGELVSYNGI